MVVHVELGFGGGGGSIVPQRRQSGYGRWPLGAKPGSGSLQLGQSSVFGSRSLTPQNQQAGKGRWPSGDSGGRMCWHLGQSSGVTGALESWSGGMSKEVDGGMVD